jgi:hypothetical protein
MMLERFWMTVAAVGILLGVAPVTTASAASGGPLTLAVYGDSPYGRSEYVPGGQSADNVEYQKSPAFIDTINAEASVSEVIHVGDIHSGKDFCTEAYDTQIATLWQSFQKPVVYTPGDNEWADCHKATSVSVPNEGGGFFSSGVLKFIGVSGLTTDSAQCVDYKCGDPIENLAKVRELFFAHPGYTLGSGTLSVVSQATAYDANFPTDRDYVENVMWAQNDIVFVTINVPGGSNNDADVWYKGASATQAQTDERSNRTGADIRWLDAAFAVASGVHAKGVVIVAQADMWDLDGKPASHLTNYESIIGEVAAMTTGFGRPVLMFNGDSHLYRSDNPMSRTALCVGEIDPATGASVCAHDPSNSAWYEHQGLNLNVPNFHRVVVHGSTTPLEWLELTIDPNVKYKTTDTTFGPFKWQRMPQPQL